MRLGELQRALRALGCTFVSEGKKHELWHTAKGRELYVPRHPKGPSPGVEKDLLKDARADAPAPPAKSDPRWRRARDPRTYRAPRHR